MLLDEIFLLSSRFRVGMRQRFFDSLKGYPVEFLVGLGLSLRNFKKGQPNTQERSRVGY